MLVAIAGIRVHFRNIKLNGLVGAVMDTCHTSLAMLRILHSFPIFYPETAYRTDAHTETAPSAAVCNPIQILKRIGRKFRGALQIHLIGLTVLRHGRLDKVSAGINIR